MSYLFKLYFYNILLKNYLIIFIIKFIFNFPTPCIFTSGNWIFHAILTVSYRVLRSIKNGGAGTAITKSTRPQWIVLELRIFLLV